jgi:hypothetical protein
MKRCISILLTLFLLNFISCKEKQKFPEVKNLSDFAQTNFVPTLENQLSLDKNEVYCATLLFAWDEIRQAINDKIIVDSNQLDLELLNKSESFRDVLKPGEFKASGYIKSETVFAMAEFSKSLPFEKKLSSDAGELVFNSRKVASFGVKGYNFELSEIVQILYYKDDTDFIIKLKPRDPEHEIVLCMSDSSFQTMAAMISYINNNIKSGLAEQKDQTSNWKYQLLDDDEIIIPKIKFNIETNFSKIEGATFNTEKMNFLVDRAWQRTAFMINESGAEIESEVEIAVESAMPGEEHKPKPKKMKFDKPFFLMLKRVDNNMPYFGLWIANTEFMETE